MSLFFRAQNPAQTRAIGDPGWPVVPPRSWASGFGATVKASQAQSEQVVAYAAAVNLLASIVSMLPLHVYRGDSSGRQQVDVKATDLLYDPQGAGYGLQDFLYQVVTSAGYSGNAVALVGGFTNLGWPSSLSPQDLGTVAVSGTITNPNWRIGKDSYAKDYVWHVRRFPRAGSIIGMSPIAQFAMTLGLAYNAEKFGAGWFADGAHPSGILTTDGDIDQATANVIKKRWLEALGGRQEPAVMYGGMKYQQIQIAPEESQFLQTQQFTSAQVCRILGPGIAEILGYASGDSQTYKNREQVAIDLLTYTIDPWLTMLEHAFSRILPRPQTVQFDRDALLRTDLIQRFQAYRIALGPTAPFLTPDEARANENLAPIPGGSDLPAASSTPPIVSNES